MLKQLAQRKRDAPARFDRRHDLSRRQRVAAQREKVTVARKRGRAHVLKRRRPDGGQLGFQCIGLRRIERRCRRPLIIAAEHQAAVFVNGVGVQGLVLPAGAAGAAL